MSEREEILEKIKKKHYLGDGAYVHHDGWHIVLTTSDGISDTNTVCLEPSCMRLFDEYRTRLKDLIGVLQKLDEEDGG